MADTKHTWGMVVPLVGGMGFGAQRALGGQPTFIASYGSHFGDNDFYAKRHFDAPYVELEEPTEGEAPPLKSNTLESFQGTDVVVSLCPCAGLSHATSTKFGSDSRIKQNMWMVRSSRRILSEVKPKVLLGENAPNLFTNAGKATREMLYEVAEECGYLMSFIKTSTDLHGIPQARPRSFFFFWRKDLCVNHENLFEGHGAPFLATIRRPESTLDAADYLLKHGDPEDATEDVSKFPLKDHALYHYLIDLYGEHWRSLGDPNGVKTGTTLFGMSAPWSVEGLTTLKLALESGRYDDYQETKGITRMCVRGLEKIAIGKGIMNASPVTPTKNNTRFRSLMWKTYPKTIHPVYDRFITYREFKLLMDIPLDFDDEGIVGDISKINVFCQNVPTITAMDAIMQARLFIEGKLQLSTSAFTWMRDDKAQLFVGEDMQKAPSHYVPHYYICEADGSNLHRGLNPSKLSKETN